MRIVKEYHWRNSEINQERKEKFNRYHASEIHQSGYFDQFGGLPEDDALRLVNKWNRSSAQWKYWID